MRFGMLYNNVIYCIRLLRWAEPTLSFIKDQSGYSVMSETYIFFAQWKLHVCVYISV
jgi:hypothetical protein